MSEQTDILCTENARVQDKIVRTQPSYAAVMSIPPISHLSALPVSPPISRILSPAHNDTLICTFDTVRTQDQDQGKVSPGALRNAIEKELSTKEDKFRCVAVHAGRQAGRVIVRARNEDELRRIKEAALKIAPGGTTVLRDQLYPLKVDNVSRLAVLNGDGSLQTSIAERLGKENNTSIAKVVWLSNKENNKAYRSMAVYFTKSGERDRYLQDAFFDAGGESGSTATFERREGQGLCYKCQKHGHKAFQCKEEQTCANCAETGHHHSTCRALVPKCATCQGPHAVFSKNCAAKSS